MEDLVELIAVIFFFFFFFKALKETKFILPQTEMIERSKVNRSTTSFLDVSNSCGIGCLLKDVE